MRAALASRNAGLLQDAVAKVQGMFVFRLLQLK